MALKPKTESQYDDALELYINECFKVGLGSRRQLAVEVYSAVQRRWPRLRGQLRASLGALKSWSKVVPYRSYRPLSWRAVLLMVYYLSGMGWWVSGCALLLGFQGVLRAGELLRIRVRDVSFHLSEGDVVAVIRLVKTKTGSNRPVRITDLVLFELCATCASS